MSKLTLALISTVFAATAFAATPPAPVAIDTPAAGVQVAEPAGPTSQVSPTKSQKKAAKSKKSANKKNKTPAQNAGTATK